MQRRFQFRADPCAARACFGHGHGVWVLGVSPSLDTHRWRTERLPQINRQHVYSAEAPSLCSRTWREDPKWGDNQRGSVRASWSSTPLTFLFQESSQARRPVLSAHPGAAFKAGAFHSERHLVGGYPSSILPDPAQSSSMWGTCCTAWRRILLPRRLPASTRLCCRP